MLDQWIFDLAKFPRPILGECIFIACMRIVVYFHWFILMKPLTWYRSTEKSTFVSTCGDDFSPEMEICDIRMVLCFLGLALILGIFYSCAKVEHFVCLSDLDFF